MEDEVHVKAPIRRSSKWRLESKTAIVTGGTKGIGRAVVDELVALGARVITCSRNIKELSTIESEIRQAGGNVVGIQADVSTYEGRENFMEAASETLGSSPLDILVNNVGTNIRRPTTELYTAQEYETVMSTNFTSAFHLSQIARPKLQNGSSITFISSVAGGPKAMSSGTPYAASKAAMNQVTRNLACEWGGDGIRVNAVAPWYTKTPLAMTVLKEEEFSRKVIDHTPLRRVAEPEEVANLVVFLSMPASSYITGQVIQIDGGYSVMGLYV
ncbi:hypothetical protein AAMO2058_000077700 [Amorphochlora amoebiformis]